MITYKDNKGVIHENYYNTNTERIDLSTENIIEIINISNLNRLEYFDLSSNKLTEIKCLDKLTNLQVLYLHLNEITEIKGLDKLINLTQLWLWGNKITEIPLTIMNLRRLQYLNTDCERSPIIERFLDRNNIKEGNTIYDDKQNVHDSHIVKSIQESIYKIISSDSKKTSLDAILKEIIDDKVIDQTTKEQLVEYCQDKTVHSILNLTFDEVLCSVWQVISEHKESDEIKNILNIEMKDSMCKCFTGRLSRLVNCLNGFDDRVTIKISDKQEILNVIIKIRQKHEDVEKQKEEVMKELTERGYEKEIIEE